MQAAGASNLKRIALELGTDEIRFLVSLRAKKSLTFFECDARNGWGARN